MLNYFLSLREVDLWHKNTPLHYPLIYRLQDPGHYFPKYFPNKN